MSLAIPRLSLQSDRATWKAEWRLEKREGDWGALLCAGQDHLVDEDPYEVIERQGNLLLIGGVSIIWEALKGTTLTGDLAAFSNANARLGVGDSTTSAADTQTALQAATNRLYKAMDATYPLHTDSNSSSGAKTISFRSSFATGEANWVWNEWVVTNVSNPHTPAGRTLNRKVENLGTKSSGTWTLTVDISIA
jgi:hypothetical protein